MLVGEKLPCPAKAGLNFVADEQNVVRPADLFGLLQVAGRRNEYASLSLNRLDQEGTGIRRDHLTQSLDIAERNNLEARREWSEAIPVLLVGREADDRRRTPMKVVGADDDLRLPLRNTLYLVAPLARGLYRRLHRLGARVHRQRHVIPGQIVQLFVEQRQLVVPE